MAAEPEIPHAPLWLCAFTSALQLHDCGQCKATLGEVDMSTHEFLCKEQAALTLVECFGMFWLSKAFGYLLCTG